MPINIMHKEILTSKQVDLLPLLKLFSVDLGMVGGTAIAFHVGHRRSIDFDLFSFKSFNNLKIRQKLRKFCKIERIVRDETGQFTLIIDGVRFTFFHYPFKINFSEKFDNIINIPDSLTLAAMKAYALGRRAKWKDYVDLYFICKKYHSVSEIISKAKEIFKNEFNEKIFRAQLSYFKDIDYSEGIDYMKGFEVSDEIVKKELVKFSLEKSKI